MLMIAAPPEEWGPHLSSGGDGRIYGLAVPVLKSPKNLVISRRSCAGTAKKCTKKREARAELLLTVAVASVVSLGPCSWRRKVSQGL